MITNMRLSLFPIYLLIFSQARWFVCIKRLYKKTSSLRPHHMTKTVQRLRVCLRIGVIVTVRIGKTDTSEEDLSVNASLRPHRMSTVRPGKADNIRSGATLNGVPGRRRNTVSAMSRRLRNTRWNAPQALGKRITPWRT